MWLHTNNCLINLDDLRSLTKKTFESGKEYYFLKFKNELEEVITMDFIGINDLAKAFAAANIVLTDHCTITKENKMDELNLGKMVIYTSVSTGAQHPAIVTELKSKDSMTPTLKLFYPSGIYDKPDVPFSEEHKNGHWSWK